MKQVKNRLIVNQCIIHTHANKIPQLSSWERIMYRDAIGMQDGAALNTRVLS